MFQDGGPKLVFAQDGMPVEQMIFRPSGLHPIASSSIFA
jgi:hypothetical protein